MAYLHCHNCGWSQDDFWDEKGYNPISTLKDDTEYLFRDKVYFDGESTIKNIIECGERPDAPIIGETGALGN